MTVPGIRLDKRSYQQQWELGAWLAGNLRVLWGCAASAAIVLYTLFIGPFLVLASFGSRRLADAAAMLWCRLVLWTAAVRVESVGRANLPANGSYILVANHQSYLDPCGLVRALGSVPRFVTKRELCAVPVFGQAVRALGQIVIDRSDPESAKRTIEAAAQTLPGGVQVCFFAEGTRSVDGSIGPFKKGAVVLGLQTGLPLVPVSISGSRHLMSKGSLVVRPGGRIRVVFGTPVPTAGAPFERRDALTAALRDAVIRAFDASL
jgi:1-acyl-sn-glycerol-3-phosphate acyltransferase